VRWDRAGSPAALAAVAVCALGAGCASDDGTVTLAFEPEPGAEVEYETVIESTTVTDFPDTPSDTATDTARLTTHQRVLEVTEDGVRVEVALTRPEIGTRTFVVRFDRAAQLTTVEQVEGIPTDALGELGLTEIFPAAAGAPPDRPLAPGERWVIDDEVSFGENDESARLQGAGRLVALGVEDGDDTATVTSHTLLPVTTTTSSTSGTRTLTGTQVSDVTATYDLADGGLRRAEAVTMGRFRVVLGPPEGVSGDPFEGTLEVEVRSTVTRAG
jgi:hypothetical protein